MSESQKDKEEKFDSEGFEKLKAAFNEYEAEQKERFKNFSVGLLKSSSAQSRLQSNHSLVEPL